MYPTSGSTIRGDLNAFVEEAIGASDHFIGAKVLPPLAVEVKNGTFPVLAKTAGELLRADSTVRTPTATFGRVERGYGSDTFECLERGAEELIDDTVAKDLSRFFDVGVASAKRLLNAVMLGHETRVADATVNATTNFSATAAGTAYTTANIATMDFPSDVLAAIERVYDNGERPNTIVLSANVLNRVKLSTKMQNFARGALSSDATLNLTAQAIANAFADNGITQVLVGRAVKDGAKKGQTYSASRIWADTYVFVGNVSAGTLSSGGIGRTLMWNQEGGLFVTETYRDEARRSDVLRVRTHSTEKIINTGAGTLITTSYS